MSFLSFPWKLSLICLNSTLIIICYKLFSKSVSKYLSKSISKRLSDLSSNVEIFEKSKLGYRNAFKKMDFNRSWVIHKHKIKMIKITIINENTR